MSKAKWLYDTIKHMEQSLLGERVSTQQGNERRNECLKCDKLKNAQVLPFVTVQVCGICKCPIDTKPFFKTHLLQAINPLVEKTGEINIVKCPHTEGDKWKEIDAKYATNLQNT
jgi:hypothetical protein